MVADIGFPALALIGYLTAGKSLLPLVSVALLLDSAIVAVWYFVGSMLKNSALKAGAISEFYQLGGTVVITIAILSTLGIAANMFSGALNSTHLMNSGTLTTMCDGLMNPGGNPNNLNILGPSYSLLSGGSSTSSTSSFPGLCNMLSPTTMGGKIDYPLVASSVIIANLTNQTVTNLNDFFYVDNFIMFLATFTPSISACLGALDTCAAQAGVSFTPYAGIDSMKRNFKNMGSILTMATESFIAQLILSSMFLYIWPYLLFIGLVLRATFFTRKIGGLFIALAIGGILFFPIMFSAEYLALGNGVPLTQAQLNAYGYNSVNAQTLQLPAGCTGGTTSKPSCGSYNLNFYTLPSFKEIAIQNQCWTPHYILDEGLDVGGWLVAPIGFLVNLVNHFLTGAPVGLFPIVCSTTNLAVMILQMWQAVAITGIITWIIPILNIMIVLSGVRGISGLMGGDTTLAGLSRLI